MWRSGAPQRRGARGAFRGADAPTRCYGQLRDSLADSTKDKSVLDHSSNAKKYIGLNGKSRRWGSGISL